MKNMVFFLIFSLSFVAYSEDSFVVKGFVSTITLAPKGVVLIYVFSEAGCEQGYFKLNPGSPDLVGNYLIVLNSALVNGLAISLHNSSGGSCKGEFGRMFDIVNVMSSVEVDSEVKNKID